MNSLFLLLMLFGGGDEPPQIVYHEPPQIVWKEPEAKPLPVWLNARYRYPNWTYPGSIYEHLFDEPHHSILKKAGYTDKQLRSISVREAELLHNHLHNYFGASTVDYGSRQRGVFAVQAAST